MDTQLTPIPRPHFLQASEPGFLRRLKLLPLNPSQDKSSLPPSRLRQGSQASLRKPASTRGENLEAPHGQVQVERQSDSSYFSGRESF